MKITIKDGSITILPTDVDATLTINHDGSITLDKNISTNLPAQKVQAPPSTIYDLDYLKKLGPITAQGTYVAPPTATSGFVQTVPGILMNQVHVNGLVPTPPIPYDGGIRPAGIYPGAIKSSLDDAIDKVVTAPAPKRTLVDGTLEKVPGAMQLPLSTAAYDGDVVSRLYENALTQAEKSEIQKEIQKKIQENFGDHDAEYAKAIREINLGKAEDVLNRFIGDQKRMNVQDFVDSLPKDGVIGKTAGQLAVVASALDAEPIHWSLNADRLDNHTIARGHWSSEEVGYATKGKQEVAEKVTMEYIDRRKEHAQIAKELLK